MVRSAARDATMARSVICPELFMRRLTVSPAILAPYPHDSEIGQRQPGVAAHGKASLTGGSEASLTGHVPEDSR